MSEMVLAWGAVLIGFVGLIWSADRFVAGSASIATNFGVSKLLIGLTIVAFGTSAPEIVVSIISALKGAGDLAVGNALGSNLANIGLVLGVTALISPIPIKGHILKQEYPIMLGVSLVAGWFLWDATLQLWEGVVLLSLLIPVLAWMAFSKKQHPEEMDEEMPEYTFAKAVLWFLVGLVLLVASSNSLVWGAEVIALHFGVSPLIIGLTVVAIGTSLPELAASVVSALKGHHDIAIGNVIGSNIFNLLVVMGIPPLIERLNMDTQVFSRDYMAMVILSAALGAFMLMMYRFKKTQARMGRLLGLLLLCLYGIYYAILFQ